MTKQHKPGKVPGIRKTMMPPNGNAPQNVPEDFVWDDDDPPFVYNCSNHIHHIPQCDGNCGGHHLNEIQTKLQNEALAWARLGMVPRGIPTAMQGGPFNGLLVELWDLEMKFEILRDFLIDSGRVTLDELDDRFVHHKLHRMQEIREEHEAAIRRARVANSLGIIEKPPIYGPDGNPMG